MGLQRIDTEYPGFAIPVLSSNEPFRLVRQEGNLGVFFRHGRRHRPGKDRLEWSLHRFSGRKSPADKKLVVIAFRRDFRRIGVILAVVVLDALPFIKSVLGEGLIAQVPLPVIGGLGSRSVRYSAMVLNLRIQADIVGVGSVIVGHQPGHDRTAGRRADRLGAIGALEAEAAFTQGPQVGRLHRIIPGPGNSVTAVLVGPEEKQVWPPGRRREGLFEQRHPDWRSAVMRRPERPNRGWPSR